MIAHRVLAVRDLTDSAFVIRLERKDLQFRTGQFIVLKDPRSSQKREYSVYSGEHDEFLEVLVREISGGKVSGRLRKLCPGDHAGLEGPFGFFDLLPGKALTGDRLFIATGTGISPFHSFVRSFPDIDFRLIHGVRYMEEFYDSADYDRKKVTVCTSGDTSGDFYGRVTGYLSAISPGPDTHCFLCGNSRMISDVFDILISKGIPVSQIYSEVYF